MFIVVALVVLCIPGVVAYKLRRTRLWWLTGVALLGFCAYVAFEANTTPVHHDDQSGLSGIGAAAEVFLCLLLVVYGLVVLGLSRHAYRVAHAFDQSASS